MSNIFLSVGDREPDEDSEAEQVDVVQEEREEEDIDDPIGEVVLDEEEEEK